MLTSRDSPEELLEMIESWEDGHHDQWQVQIQSQLLMRHEIYLKSGYLSAGTGPRGSPHGRPRTSRQVIEESLDRHGGR